MPPFGPSDRHSGSTQAGPANLAAGVSAAYAAAIAKPNIAAASNRTCASATCVTPQDADCPRELTDAGQHFDGCRRFVVVCRPSRNPEKKGWTQVDTKDSRRTETKPGVDDLRRSFLTINTGSTDTKERTHAVGYIQLTNRSGLVSYPLIFGHQRRGIERHDGSLVQGSSAVQVQSQPFE